MKKVKTLFLMLFLILSGALCHASGVAGQENKRGNDGIPISVIEKSSHSGTEKGSTIQAYIEGHMLTVSFTENLGDVAIEITTATGFPVDYFTTPTPNGLLFYIPFTGDYIITFTLPNGDEYYGEITVTE